MPRGALAAVAVVAVLGVAAAAFLFLRGEQPPPVSLDQALAVAAATPETAAVISDGREPAVASQREGPGGTWVLDPAGSFVGYRVREELAGFGWTTAVGRTSTLEGRLDFDGEAIVAAAIVADLRDLRSDDSRRDRQLRRQALETDRFPEATFVLLEPIVIGHVPRDGVTVTALALGELTLHGVTRPVEVRLDGQVRGNAVVVVGSLPIAFADYDIGPPSAPLVLAVEDHGVMELQLVFRR